MATVVGQASAAATSVAIPAHSVGDLIIVSARGTAAPTVPAASGTVPAWATLQSAAANSVGLTTVAFVATATNTTTGTFTGATHICVLVLRPASLKKLQTAAARSSTGNGNNTQTIIYPALTLNNGGGAGTSVGVRIGTRGTADSEVGTNVPASWTNQSIQPAGASALMAVHTRLTLPGNPTADSIATTGTNAAYRAHTVEVEEVPLGSTVTFAATITRAAAVAVASTVLPPPITFGAVITTNQPYAGVYDCGEFTCGVGSPVAVDLQIVSIDLLDGLVAGQAQVGASLSRDRSSAVTVGGVGAVTAQQALTRGVAESIVGSGAVTAQQAVTRALAAAVTGAGAVAADTFVGHTISFGCTVTRAASVTADIIRVPVTVVYAATVAGASVVAPSLTVTNANFISLDAAVSGQGSLSVQSASQRSLAAAISGVGSLATQQAPLRGFAANIARAAAVTPDLTVTAPVGGPVFFAATIARQASVVADTSRVGAVIDFACSLGQPLAGQRLCGTFLVGSGPGATVEAQMGPVVTYLSASITGKATVLGSERGQRELTVTISRASAVAVQNNLFRGLEASIARAGAVSANLIAFRIVQLEARLEVIPHLCGQYLAGQQVVGGTGPRANIAVNVSGLRTTFDAPISGKALVSAEMRTGVPLSAVVGGQANVAGLLTLQRVLASAISGQAALKAKIGLGWITPSLPSDILLDPTDEASWILVPTVNGSATLVPSTSPTVVLDPTDEEDLLLVPTTERTM